MPALTLLLLLAPPQASGRAGGVEPQPRPVTRPSNPSADRAEDLSRARSLVEACWRDHLRRPLGFTRTSVAGKRKWLTPGLAELLHRELNRPQDPGEAPYINGDPFLDSQEPVTSLEVGEARMVGDRIEVPLALAGEGFTRQLRVRLRRLGPGWRIDDLHYEDGQTLRDLLAAARKG